MREVIRMLVGGCVVYGIVAACSAESARVSPRNGERPDASPSIEGTGGAFAGMGGMLGAGGQPTSDGGLTDASTMDGGGLLDVITEPVPDANAAESGSRLKARWRVASDGAREFVGWRDTERNEDCVFSLASDGQIRCRPQGAGFTMYYGDAACTQPIVPVVKLTDAACATALTPKYATLYESCPAVPGATQILLLAAAPVGVPSSIYLKSGAECIATTPSDTSDYYPGTPVPESSFVAATEMVDG